MSISICERQGFEPFQPRKLCNGHLVIIGNCPCGYWPPNGRSSVAIEKMLKAYYSANYNTPPYTHNLKHLANKTNIYNTLTEKQKDIIDLLLPLNIEARYPTYKEQLLRSLSHEKCIKIIEKTKSLKEWIEQQL